MRTPDAVVVGSGPNGLAAAVTLARAGMTVEVYEGAGTPGGGCRTAELTLPDFRHDVCSSVHPLLATSPFFRSVDLAARSVELVSAPIAFAHPLGGGACAVVESVDRTADGLGVDGSAYRLLFGPLVRDSASIVPTVLAPLRSLPRHPVAMARFARAGVLPLRRLADRFATREARAVLAGAAAHSGLPLDAPLTGAYAILLVMLAHDVGWPVVRGGSAAIVDALVAELESLGSRIVTGRWIRSLADLPAVEVTLLDVSPHALAEIGGARMPARERRALDRVRHGPGVCKVDWALSGPVPWAAQACRETPTVHVGGTLEEIATSESEVAGGRHAERPFCIVVQPGVVDRSRAPGGQQTLWAYCHVPSGSGVDMAARMEAQIERFAPGFRDLVIARRTTTAASSAHHNPNRVGGDITGGAATLRQTVCRPTARWNPYATGIDGVYLCSASTPPGGGVHGMCGFLAATAALADVRRTGRGTRDR